MGTKSYAVKRRQTGEYICRKGNDSTDINNAQIFGTLPTITGYFSGVYGAAAKSPPWYTGFSWYDEIKKYGIDGAIQVIEVELIEKGEVEFPAKALRKQFAEE